MPKDPWKFGFRGFQWFLMVSAMSRCFHRTHWFAHPQGLQISQCEPPGGLPHLDCLERSHITCDHGLLLESRRQAFQQLLRLWRTSFCRNVHAYLANRLRGTQIKPRAVSLRRMAEGSKILQKRWHTDFVICDRHSGTSDPICPCL